MSEAITTRLEKLDNDNWMVWSTRMEDHLTVKDLLEAITPEFMPETPTAEQFKMDRKAFALLRTHVSDSLIHFLDSSMTAYQAWTVLSELHVSNSFSKIRGLIKAVVRLQLKPHESINEYIGRAKALQLSLRMANEPISEILLVTAILGGLPRDYQTIVIILESEDSILSVTSVQLKLCAMELTIRDSSSATPGAQAMSAKVNIICGFCKKTGHTEDRCWRKFPEQNPGNSERTTTAMYETAPAVGAMSALTREPPNPARPWDYPMENYQ
jgi:hypothetical protein